MENENNEAKSYPIRSVPEMQELAETAYKYGDDQQASFYWGIYSCAARWVPRARLFTGASLY